MSQPNLIQKAIGWVLQKAAGFPAWTTSNYSGQLSGANWNTGGDPLGLAYVFGVTRVICNTMGSLPLHVYRKTKSGGKEKAQDHPLYELLHNSPNAYMTSMEWREAMFHAWCLRGNGFTEKKTLDKRIVSLNPLHPDRVAIKYENGLLVYQYTELDGTQRVLPYEAVLHYKNFSIDGINGVSPLRKEIIQHGLDAQRFGSAFLRNGGRPAGAIKFKMGEGPKDPEARARLRKEIMEKHGSPDTIGQPLMLYDGGEYQAISISPEDAQFIETMGMVASEIAAIFGVPMNKLAQSDKTATYASAEQFNMEFVQDTVRPHAVRFEQMLNKSLLAGTEFFVEHDLDGLLRGDSASQATYFSTMTQNGIMTRNEVRRKLNLPEVEGADELTVQTNLIDIDKLASAVLATGKPAGGKEPDGKT